MKYSDRLILAGVKCLIVLPDDGHCPPAILNREIVHVGWDSEYVEGDGQQETVSVQLWFYELHIGLLLRPASNDRLSLSKLVEIAHAFLVRRRRGIKLLRFVSHFISAEMAGLDCGKDLKRWARGVQLVQDKPVSVTPSEYRYHDGSRNPKKIFVSFHDTYLLAGQVSLRELGESIGVPKVRLPAGAIENIKAFASSNWDLFVSYAMNDAYIAVRWFCEFLSFMEVLVGPVRDPKTKIPVTASHLAAQYVQARIPNATKVLTGHSGWIKRNPWGTASSRYDIVEFLGRVSYFGGRNETFWVGNIDGDFFDYDLKSAYPLALACADDVDWANPVLFNDAAKLPSNPLLAGFATVDFRFRSDLKYPAAPVLAPRNRGLVFPLEGTTTLTIPELWTFIKNDLLESFTIHHACYFPALPHCRLSEVVVDLIKKRQAAPKGSVQNLVLKLLSNSIYGKLAEGINPEKKRCDLLKTLESNKISREPSRPGGLFSPFLAAYVTGFCRALMAEYLTECDRRSIDVVSVTTDGFIVKGELPSDLVDGSSLMLGSIVSRVRQIRLGDDHADLLEVKHHFKGMASFKTRCGWGLDADRLADPAREHEVMLQRGGVQTKGMLPSEAVSYLTSAAVMNRMQFPQKRVSSFRDSILPGGRHGIHTEEREVSHNRDYDLKRQIVEESITEVPLTDGCHTWEVPTFRTRPWPSVEEFFRAREQALPSFTKKKTNVFRTREVVSEFCNYQRLYEIADGRCAGKSLEDLIRDKIIRLLLRQGCDRRKIALFMSASAQEISNLSRRPKPPKAVSRDHFPDAVACAHQQLSNVPQPWKDQVLAELFCP